MNLGIVVLKKSNSKLLIVRIYKKIIFRVYKTFFLIIFL